MAYINTETNQYPISEQEIRSAHPNTSFPLPFVPPDGYAWVFPAPQPSYNAITHGVREIAPELANGNWEQRWETYALDPAVVAANQAAADERLFDSIVDATQKRLDDFAKTRNYDGILSATTYADSLVQRFRNEGQYCLAQRDATWAALYDMLAEVQAGTRPKPASFADIEAELPALEWPQ